MKDVVLLGAKRSAIGSMSGVFSNTSTIELGKACAMATVNRSGVPMENIEEVIFGTVIQAGQGQNPARQIALGIGCDVTVPAYTVNKLCGSGMKTLDLAWQSMQLGRAQAILTGGAENMTQAPYLLPALRGGTRLGHTQVIDSLLRDGLWDVYNDYHMGITAENIAEQYGITREEQDQFAFNSQQKCGQALEAGTFNEEIVPITVKQRKKETVIDTDEHPKPGTTLEKMASLRPAFRPDGSVTAANASGINDGAASIMVVAEDAVPDGAGGVYLRDVRACGCDPCMMGLGPIGAVRKLLEHNALSIGDVGLWELNEAFAAQSIAVIRDLGMDESLVNVNGGAIALGHPIGCSGTRIVVTLIHEMKRRDVRYGIAAMCIGGGMGIGCLLENRA